MDGIMLIFWKMCTFARGYGILGHNVRRREGDESLTND